MKALLIILAVLGGGNVMGNDSIQSGAISSTPEINAKLVEELRQADIEHRVDEDGIIWFDKKYQRLVSAMSTELVKDIFRPYQEAVPGNPEGGVIRPVVGFEGAVFIRGTQTKFGNFANSITYELADNKKIEDGDHETISKLLSEFAKKYAEWVNSKKQ